MNAKLILPAALATTAIAAAPALAHDPGHHEDQVKGHHVHGADDNGHHVHGADDNGHHGKAEGKSKRCTPRRVAYVASGTLASQTLTKNADGTYDGTLTVNVTRSNNHAKSDKGTARTYTLDDARLSFDVPDRDANGTVDAADLRAGDRVKVIGRITRLKKRCDSTGFTPTVTVKKVRFHEPKAS